MLDAHSTSPPPPPPPPSPSPSSSRSPPSSLSFHDVYLFFKRPLDRCLNEIVSFINFVTAAPTPSCKNCQRLRATHKSNCAECQTKMNTRRNTLLGLECAANPKEVLQTPAEVEDSQAFVDHLLHLDSPRPQHRIGQGGIELHSGHNLSVNSPSQLIQVNKSARSLNAVGLEQGRSETNPVMVKGRSHSDSSYPVGRHTKRRHLDLRSQAIRGSNITSTSSLVPERSLTVTSQPRLHHRSSSRRRGDRNANLRHGNPQPPVVDSTSQPKVTFGSYETFSNSGSSSVDSSLHFPPSSADKKGGSSERTNSFFIPPFVSSSSLLSSSSTSTSTSLPHGGHLEGGRSGASPRLTPAHKHGFDNPLFQNP
ncbi:uncharacterized protein LOC126988001 isoform X4 [Eriocheir sinensis]|uniref:uncharacterized protein LOC126988001 isoform X4 n=1 Tax=Eriocheir sinensis TaxID=95602 RepID=UPI0021C78953|nr:uncharacterized protein LOC126988001 isoform X4 [Eriocheir sinensis]